MTHISPTFKTSALQKVTVAGMKDQPQTVESSRKPISNKEVVFEIFKELSKPNNKETSNPIKKRDKTVSSSLTRNDIQVGNEQWMGSASSITSKLKPQGDTTTHSIQGLEMGKSDLSKCWKKQ